VWVELRGRRGELVLGTDRRLIAIDGSSGRLVVDWPWEEIDDVAPVGRRGAIRIRRRDRTRAFELEPSGDASDVMQAVTVLALLAVDAARYGARLDALRRMGRADPGEADVPSA